MATTKFNHAIDLQITIARIAALENIQSHTLMKHGTCHVISLDILCDHVKTFLSTVLKTQMSDNFFHMSDNLLKMI